MPLVTFKHEAILSKVPTGNKKSPGLGGRILSPPPAQPLRAPRSENPLHHMDAHLPVSLTRLWAPGDGAVSSYLCISSRFYRQMLKDVLEWKEEGNKQTLISCPPDCAPGLLFRAGVCAFPSPVLEPTMTIGQAAAWGVVLCPLKHK